MPTLGPYELNQIYTGDARELSKAIPDESIDLIFTDPVYDRIEDYVWLAEAAARVLKPGGSLIAFCANSQGVTCVNITLASGLDWCDWLVFRETARRRKRWDKRIIGLYELAYWVSKGKSRTGGYLKNFTFVSNGYVKTDTYHDWQKEVGGVIPWIRPLSEGVTFDSFTGGGTVPAVCKMLNRNYLAFEIDPDTADLARQRVANTQPPLPMTYHEQGVLI